MKRGRIAVALALAMEPARNGPHPIPQIPCRQGRRDRLQFGTGGWAGDGPFCRERELKFA